MRHDWVTARLEELCDFTSGLWKGETPPLIKVGILRNTNFTPAGYLDDSDVAFLDVEEAKFATRQLQIGDIILEKSGGGPKQPVGRVALFEKVGEKYSFSNFTAAIRVKDVTLLDYRFLHKLLYYYYVSGRTEPLQRHSTGIRNLQLSAYKRLEVALPPISEQRQIVATLDETFPAIDAAIAKIGKNLANARELFHSCLNSVFSRNGASWLTTKLEEHVNFIDYRGRTPTKTDKGLRLITAKNVKMGLLQVDPQEFVDPTIYQKWMTRGIPQRGDVLFTTEAPLANVAQLDTDEQVVFAQRVIILQPDRKVLDPTFLKFMLMSRVMQERIHAEASGATAQGIKASRLKHIPISFPRALSDQHALVEKLASIEAESRKLEAVYRSKLLCLAELKQSFLRKAFAGELTAKEAEREMAAA